VGTERHGGEGVNRTHIRLPGVICVICHVDLFEQDAFVGLARRRSLMDEANMVIVPVPYCLFHGVAMMDIEERLAGVGAHVDGPEQGDEP